MRFDEDPVAEAIADEMFGSDRAGQPVYTLADAPTLERIARTAGLPGDPVVALAMDARSKLSIDGVSDPPFAWQANAAGRHAHQPLETPAGLSLLVLLTLAAERMQADSEAPAHNYYSRLHSLLQVPSNRQHRVEEDYRKHAVEIWGSLNAWLEAWEGARGIPTAYAIGGHAFIGLPLSQAVVREHDRGGLHTMFAMEGVTAGQRLAPSDMDAVMAPYASHTPSPLSTNLRRLWGNAASRERIVEAACLELESWDGSGQRVQANTQFASTTRLLAFLRHFPNKSVEFNLSIPDLASGATVARFITSTDVVDVPTITSTAGSTRLASVEAIATDSLLGDVVVGALGGDDGHPFGRRPRRVVPLRWDDLQGAYVEVERISLGEDSLVLTRQDAHQRVEAYLAAQARPGWAKLSDLRGVPEGWLIFEHVQIVSSSGSSGLHVDLLPLVPRALTSLTLRGGFVMPGLLRKWASLDPPEIVALASDASSLTVRVYSGSAINDTALVAEAHIDDELLVAPLAQYSLSDGEYIVAMFVDDRAKPSSTALLRLRSADTPQFSVDDEDIRLVYSPESSGRWPISGGPARWPTYINGARLSGPIPEGMDTLVMPEFVPRDRQEATKPTWRVSVGTPMSESSCLITGMHKFHLPPTRPGQPVRNSIDGECDTCGLVKRFAGTARAARKREPNAADAGRALHIPPIVESDEPAFEVAFDAMNHVGHGTYGTFERIAAQIEGSGLFADRFLRRHEVVGNIDVARDEWLQVTEWAVNSATLVPVDSGRWALVGSRSRGLLERLRAALGDHASVNESVDAELSRVEITSEDGSLEPKRTELGEIGVALLATSPSLEITRMLPTLGSLARRLHRVVVPGFRTAERWDTKQARWELTDTLALAGAYRLKDFRSTYIVRSLDDLDAGTMGVGNAQLVKHIANMWARDPLVGYNARSNSVVAPLGADLPGLYGRALSVASGRAPREIADHRMVQYPSVPRDIANALFAKLSE